LPNFAPAGKWESYAAAIFSLRAIPGRFLQTREKNHFPSRGNSFPISELMSADFDVRYVAQLARLNLSDAEIAKFQTQLSQVLEYVEKLNQVDVSGVDPTAHTSPVFNVFRADVPRDWFTAKEALSNAPRQANGLFSVTKVVE
jgi:aspartyl-tRNA(Asn)/glutamyl-tRNA(Gln) amidotransferase subunit C